MAIDLAPYPDSPPPDARWDGTSLPIRRDWASAVLLTEVLEHSPRPDLLLQECARVLAPKGTLYFSVPFLWPLHDAPHDEFRYTPFALDRLLGEAGFAAEMWALGGWDASLGQMLGLWVRRRPMNRVVRRLLSVALLPLVSALDRMDDGGALDGDGMITGIAGTATLTVDSPV